MPSETYPNLTNIPKRPFLVTLHQHRLSVLIVFFSEVEDGEPGEVEPIFFDEATTRQSARMSIDALFEAELITREDMLRLYLVLGEITLPDQAESLHAIGPLTVQFIRLLGGGREEFLDEVLEDEDDRKDMEEGMNLSEIALALWADTPNDYDTVVIHDEPASQSVMEGSVLIGLWNSGGSTAVG